MPNIDKLVLGTVQLGLEYGINNKSGKPSREESFRILGFAYKKGIHIFDTAHAYGNAEEILGEFLKNCKDREEIKIVTKINPENPEDVLLEIKKFLKKLGLASVDGCLFHNPKHIKNGKMVDALSEFKKQGLVKNIGVSVYEPEDAVYSAKMNEIDYIQIPYNIFDQRLDRTNFFELTGKNKKKVFARSIFLQGLLLMEGSKVPEHLGKAKMYLGRLDKIILKYGLSRQEAALLFVLKNPGIDYAVFGADNIKHIEENANIAKSRVVSADCFEKLKNDFANVDENIISPNLWKK